MKIKGRVSQIIEKKYFYKYFNKNRDYINKDKNYIVVLLREDSPKLGIIRWIWSLNKRDEDWFFPCSLNNFNSKINDIIEVEVEPYYEKTETYFEK